MKKCLCGNNAEQFEPDVDTETGETCGVVAIINGEPCCSAFNSRKYRSYMDFAAFAQELNTRRNVDLGVEAGAC